MPSLADVWEQHHGRAMTDEEAEMIAARAPEVEAALAKMMPSLSGPTRLADGTVATPKASNWPARETDGFTPIARIEVSSEDRRVGKYCVRSFFFRLSPFL